VHILTNPHRQGPQHRVDQLTDYWEGHCAVTGFTGGTWASSATAYSIDSCISSCINDSRCVAVAFVAPANYCALFSVAPTILETTDFGVYDIVYMKSLPTECMMMIR
jgi:hypothetical protein